MSEKTRPGRGRYVPKELAAELSKRKCLCCGQTFTRQFKDNWLCKPCKDRGYVI